MTGDILGKAPSPCGAYLRLPTDTLLQARVFSMRGEVLFRRGAAKMDPSIGGGSRPNGAVASVNRSGQVCRATYVHYWITEKEGICRFFYY